MRSYHLLLCGLAFVGLVWSCSPTSTGGADVGVDVVSDWEVGVEDVRAEDFQRTEDVPVDEEATVLPEDPFGEMPDMEAQAGSVVTIPVALKEGVEGRLIAKIRGESITDGEWVNAVDKGWAEFYAGTLNFRIDPRATGTVDVMFRLFETGTEEVLGTELVEIVVTPPTLYDGVRLDGKLDDFELEFIDPYVVYGVGEFPLYNLSDGTSPGTIQVETWLAYDTEYAYFVVRWEDSEADRDFDLNEDVEPQRVDLVQLRIDNNGDGVWGPGEDCRSQLLYLTGSGYLDQHRGETVDDILDDEVVDGGGGMNYFLGTGSHTAEFLIPRLGDPLGEDADLLEDFFPPHNFLFMSGFGSAMDDAAWVASVFEGSGEDSSGWASVEGVPEMGVGYASPWGELAGTLWVIAEFDDPKGELYELDLASGEMKRLTFNDRFEDTLSVAPDGSWGAYMSAPESNAYAEFEIYRFDKETGVETALTENLALDGHPAISPDGSEIAFARFGSSGTADLFLMNADGSDVRQVTDTEVEENDPEWTFDGNLLVKTTSWSENENLGIMDVDGGWLVSLTEHDFSDHDPVSSADHKWVLFERFEGAGQWNADLNLQVSTPWTIRMVSTDGEKNRLVVGDDQMNWLPVMGPDGFVAYIKNNGFNGNELRLTDSFGWDLGRLAPGTSRIRYLDWK